MVVMDQFTRRIIGFAAICSADRNVIAIDDDRWRSYCRGLYQLPSAA